MAQLPELIRSCSVYEVAPLVALHEMVYEPEMFEPGPEGADGAAGVVTVTLFAPEYPLQPATLQALT